MAPRRPGVQHLQPGGLTRHEQRADEAVNREERHERLSSATGVSAVVLSGERLLGQHVELGAVRPAIATLDAGLPCRLPAGIAILRSDPAGDPSSTIRCLMPCRTPNYQRNYQDVTSDLISSQNERISKVLASRPPQTVTYTL
jgi:hypothetical protein